MVIVIRDRNQFSGTVVVESQGIRIAVDNGSLISEGCCCKEIDLGSIRHVAGIGRAVLVDRRELPGPGGRAIGVAARTGCEPKAGAARHLENQAAGRQPDPFQVCQRPAIAENRVGGVDKGKRAVGNGGFLGRVGIVICSYGDFVGVPAGRQKRTAGLGLLW